MHAHTQTRRHLKPAFILNRVTVWLALLGVVSAFALMVRLRAEKPVLPPPVPPPAKPYATAVAGSGIVEASRENTAIGVPAPGLVQRVCVKVWDRVEPGQPVLQLDDRDLRAQLVAQEAAVDVAGASLRRLEDQLARLRAVKDPRAVSTEEVRTRENDVAVAKAQLDAARAQVSATRLLIDRMTVRAPIAGTILQVNTREGEYAGIAPAKPLLVLGDIDNLQVRADVDEQLAPRVRQGAPATAYLKGETDNPIPLEFVRIEPFVIPKVSLTGGSMERVDTRVLQVIYRFRADPNKPVYVGQQMDLYIREPLMKTPSSHAALRGAVLTLAAALAGCTLPVHEQKPTPQTPQSWAEAPVAPDQPTPPEPAQPTATEPAPAAAQTPPPPQPAALSDTWWRVFGDPVLDKLQERALAANPDLARSLARVDESRALARGAGADRMPTVNAEPSFSRGKTSGTLGVPLQGGTANTFTLPVSLRYEVDLWGRVRQSLRAAAAEAALAEADAAAVRLVLSAEVARTYVQLRTLAAEAGVVRANFDSRKENLSLQESRRAAGLITEADVSRAKLEAALAESELRSIQRQEALARHALAVLLGEPPGNELAVPELVAASEAVSAVREEAAAREARGNGPSVLPEPPVIPAGLPSDLLKRRPDVAAADLALDAALARIGVAKAAFYPTLRLTGMAGWQSAELRDLIDPASRVWSIGPSITIPFLEGGRNQANLDATRARFAEAVATYRQRVIGAFRDVEDALSDLKWLAEQERAQREAMAAARDALELVTARYNRGLVSYLEVITAEDRALQTARAATQLRGLRLAATVQLARALGGGWQGLPADAIDQATPDLDPLPSIPQ